MASWYLNRTPFTGSRNGTNSHTVTFAAATAGSLLMLIVEGGVTDTVSGWTQYITAVSDTGTTIFTKTAAAGESSATITHNGSNYPVTGIVYEFPSGTTGAVTPVAVQHVAGSTNNSPTTAALPTPAAGHQLVAIAAAGAAVPSTSIATFTWGSPWSVDYAASAPASGGTDGYDLSVGIYLDPTPGAAVSAAVTSSATYNDRVLVVMDVPVPAGKRVLMVTNDSYVGNLAGDASGLALYNRMRGNGFFVTQIGHTAVPTGLATNYDVVWITNSCPTAMDLTTPGYTATTIPVIATGVRSPHPNYASSAATTPAGTQQTIYLLASGVGAPMVDPSLTEGTYTVLDTAYQQRYEASGNFGSGVHQVAAFTSTALTSLSWSYYNSGDTMRSATTAPSKRAWFLFHPGSIGNNGSGWKFMDSLLNWALGITSGVEFISKYDAPGANNAGGVNLTLPTGIVDNDILVAGVVQYDVVDTWVTPSGWTLKASGSVGGVGTFNWAIFWKRVAGDTAGSTARFEFSNNTNTHWVQASMKAFRGCVTTGDPFSEYVVVPPADASTNVTSTPAASLTTTIDNSLLLFEVLASNTAAASLTPPSGFILRNTNPTGDAYATMSKQSAGATGPHSATWDFGGVSSVFLGSLRPAVVVAPASKQAYVWDGTSWVAKSTNQVWDGSTWVTKSTITVY